MVKICQKVANDVSTAADRVTYVASVSVSMIYCISLCQSVGSLDSLAGEPHFSF